MIVETITQKMAELFFSGLRTANVQTSAISAPEYAGTVVRIACQAGIVTIDEKLIDDMKPGRVVYIAQQVDERLAEALKIDPF